MTFRELLQQEAAEMRAKFVTDRMTAQQYTVPNNPVAQQLESERLAIQRAFAQQG